MYAEIEPGDITPVAAARDGSSTYQVIYFVVPTFPWYINQSITSVELLLRFYYFAP